MGHLKAGQLLTTRVHVRNQRWLQTLMIFRKIVRLSSILRLVTFMELMKCVEIVKCEHDLLDGDSGKPDHSDLHLLNSTISSNFVNPEIHASNFSMAG